MRGPSLAACVLGSVLAACASEPDIRACPPVGSPAGVERVTVFAPNGGEDLTEVVFEAEVDGIQSVCEYDDDGVEVALNVRLVAERGPADVERQADLRYFVAVEDGVGVITAKEIYEVSLPFEGNQRRVGIVEEIDIRIPAPEDNSFAEVRVVVGFQITPEQVDYNRRRRVR